MGRWVENCRECDGNCVASQELRDIWGDLPENWTSENWRFEAWMEGPGHNWLMRDKPLKEEGSWVVGIYNNKNKGDPVLLEFVVGCWGGDGPAFYLKVKAEHNSCPWVFQTDYDEEIHILRSDFLEHWPKLFSDKWGKARTRSDAESSVSVCHYLPNDPAKITLDLDDVKYALIEAIQEIDERGWTSN